MFADAVKALGGMDGVDDAAGDAVDAGDGVETEAKGKAPDPADAQTETTPEKPEKQKVPAARAAEPDGDGDDPDDPEPVTVADHVRRRQARAEEKRRLREKEQALEQRQRELMADIERREERLRQLEEAKANKDFETIAKLSGYGSWAEMTRAEISKQVDPTTTAVERLEARLDRQEREQQEERRRIAEAEAANAKKAQAQVYIDKVAERLLTLEGVPTRLRKDPRFLEQVIEVQREHYDPDLEETLPLKQAVKIVVDSLKETKEALAQALSDEEESSAGGTPATETPAGGARTTETTAKKGKKPLAVSQDDLADASPEMTIDKVGAKKHLDFWGRKMQKAADAQRG